MRRSSFTPAIAVVLLAGACGGGGPGAERKINGPGKEWPESFWNPAPTDGDLVIEGPCGSRFVFRAVATPTESNWLADMNVPLGQSALSGDNEAMRAITEQVRQGSVVGAFSDSDDPSDRHYYIGKYEVTANQYAAVMGNGCATPTEENNIPIDRISRFDAIEFARRLSEFGFSHSSAKARLPTVSGEAASVRLPTEAEWEFAARGGASVSVEDRLAPSYPMDGNPLQFEWFNSDDSCRGNLQSVGLLLPNPLGLHDMLGNVSEIVLDPFQLNRGGRLHGQPGGAMAKGGSCETRVEELRSAAREEFPDYDVEAGLAYAPAFTGFRLALGAPAIPSNQRLEAMEADWGQLRQTRTGAASGDDPATALRDIAGRIPDLKVAEDIAREAQKFDAEMAKRAEVESSTARASVAVGALLVRSYRFSMREIASREAALATLRQSSPDAAQAVERQLVDARAVAAITRDFYAQSLVSAADNYPETVLNDALKQVGADLRARYDRAGSDIPLANMACMFASQVKRYAANRPPGIQDYLEQIATAPPQDFVAACR